MYLAGQGRAVRRARSAPRPRDGGYAMAALLTALAVMSVLMSAALPVWRHQMQREREAELVFRGEQYVHAIGLYQRRYRTFPPGIDVLVQQRFLRKKYKDPITGEDFRPIYAGSIGQPQAPAQQQTVGQSARAAQIGSGGIVGVASTSEKDSIRIYKGRSKYNQWQFVYADMARRPGSQPRPGVPGPGGIRTPGGPGPGMGRPGGPGPGMGRPGGPGPGGVRPPGGPGGPGGPPPGGPFGPPRQRH